MKSLFSVRKKLETFDSHFKNLQYSCFVLFLYPKWPLLNGTLMFRAVWASPCLVHQIGPPCFVVIQVLLELVVDGSGIVLQRRGMEMNRSGEACVMKHKGPST